MFAPCLYVCMIPLIGISQGLRTPEELKNRLTKVTYLFLDCGLMLAVILTGLHNCFIYQLEGI